MRDLIAYALSWALVLFPRHTRRPGRHSAAYLAARMVIRPAAPEPDPSSPVPAREPTAPTPATATAQPVPEHVRERLRPLVGEETELIRPYLAAHERDEAEWERRRQRDRRTAAALATMGIDFAGVAA